MANFGSENSGTWFYFDEENKAAGGVCLRVLGTEEYEKIERITVRSKKKFKRGVAYDDITTDERLASKMRWDYCIADWKNVQIDGVEVECNKANKLRLIKINDFIMFVGDCLESLTEKNEAIEEARLGNSETSSSGNADPVE